MTSFKDKPSRIISYVISAIVIVNGVYIFFQLSHKKTPRETYTDAEVNALYESCYATAKVSKYYPEISKLNCQCITDAVTNKFTKEEWIKIDSLSPEQRNEAIKDIIIKCAHQSGRDTVHVLNRLLGKIKIQNNYLRCQTLFFLFFDAFARLL